MIRILPTIVVLQDEATVAGHVRGLFCKVPVYIIPKAKTYRVIRRPDMDGEELVEIKQRKGGE